MKKKEYIDLVLNKIKKLNIININKDLNNLTLIKTVKSYNTAHAQYDAINNIVYYNKKKVLTHELLHYFSTNIKDNKIYSGVLIVNNDDNTYIGNCINEVLTVYLDKKLFNNKDKTLYDYYLLLLKPYLKEIGFDTIAKLYFTNDKELLIKELIKYFNNEEKVNELIKTLDKCLELELTSPFDYKYKNKLLELLEESNLYKGKKL